MDARYLKSGIDIFILVTIAAFLGRHYGLYAEFWYYDIILHTLSGMAMGAVWLWLVRKEKYKNRWLLLLSVIMAGVFGSFLWEVWEYVGTYFMPASAEFYMPELGDSLGDIACGLAGAFGIGMFHLRKLGR